MVYIYALPIIAISIIIYIVSKEWKLKVFNFLSKIIIIISSIFFVITYGSYLGYNIPIVSNFCNSLGNYFFK